LTSLEYKVLRIANIYDWITATAASKISRRICAMISTVNNVCLIDGPLFPRSVNSKWPAIILAVRRTANVPGRIRFLIVSMMTMNVISIVGVPCGTKCSNMWLVFNMNLIHKDRARVSVRIRCLVLVKIYGNSPTKLFIKIIRNNDVRINEFPLFSFPFLRIVFISWCSLFINNLIIILFCDGINQILVGISNTPIVVLVQFSGRLLISVFGSKIENRLLITFSWFW